MKNKKKNNEPEGDVLYTIVIKEDGFELVAGEESIPCSLCLSRTLLIMSLQLLDEYHEENNEEDDGDDWDDEDERGEDDDETETGDNEINLK